MTAQNYLKYMAIFKNYGLTLNTKKNTSSINNETGGNVSGKSICSMLLMVPVSDNFFFFSRRKQWKTDAKAFTRRPGNGSFSKMSSVQSRVNLKEN